MKILSLNIMILCLFLMGCKNNLIETKDENGQIIEKYTVNNEGEKEGLYEAFYKDGTLKESSNYINGQLDGERKIYFENGQVEIIENHVDNVVNGIYRVFYPTGQKNIESNYVNGVLEGLLKKYDSFGNLKEEVTFSNNEENGKFIEYYANGQKDWEGSYLNGDNEYGLLLKYDSTGVLIKKMMCDSLAVCRTIWTLEKGDITPKY